MNSLVEIDSEHFFDVFDKLSNDRILFINGQITENLASEITATLLVKDRENNQTPITLFINSFGGNIIDVFSIYDTMMLIDSPINTIAVGEVRESSVLILAAGSNRYITSNTHIVLSQLENLDSIESSLVDAEIFHQRHNKLNDKFLKLLSVYMEFPVSKLKKELVNKKYLTADQAINYGVVDGKI